MNDTIFMNSVVIVALWMILIQMSRYTEHSKKHASNDKESKEYKLANKASPIYWVIPMGFVFLAALVGQTVAGYVTPSISFTGVNESIIAPVVSLMSYLGMDIKVRDDSLISKVCDSLYYLTTERDYGTKPVNPPAIQPGIDPEDPKTKVLTLYDQLNEISKK